MSKILRVFPNAPKPLEISHAQGYYLFTPHGREILDTTSGATSHMILGWRHPAVESAIQEQLKKYSHIDYKAWTDPNCELLSNLLVDHSKHGLDKVYFCGNSGGEACEAAIKMSYQWHCENGLPNKQWVISRDQSYHGSSSDAMCLGDRGNLEIYRPILPVKRARICEHNPIRHQLADESLEAYTRRTTQALEDKILELGPDRVCAFVGETMMGGLIGDVPPSPSYWQQIRTICTKYNVHLILDEVYCGTGTSGRMFCIDWDGVSPDFIFMGKTLAAGYAPISVVMTSAEFESAIKNGSGRLQHSTTHQAYSLGVAAAIAVQNEITQAGFLENVNALGAFMRNSLEHEFSQHSAFRQVRGRGLRFSFEYLTKDNIEFSRVLQKRMLEEHHIFIDSKWHRICFTPSLNFTKEDAERVLTKLIDEINILWPKYT